VSAKKFDVRVRGRLSDKRVSGLPLIVAAKLNGMRLIG
jgi:hypothetical protein